MRHHLKEFFGILEQPFQVSPHPFQANVVDHADAFFEARFLVVIGVEHSSVAFDKALKKVPEAVGDFYGGSDHESPNFRIGSRLSLLPIDSRFVHQAPDKSER
jgi:hypothetical protein